MVEDISTLYTYNFPLIPISRISVDSPELKDYLYKELPVVIEGSNLVGPALEKWDLGYLTENLGDRGLYNVMQTKGHQMFKYFDQNKVTQLKGKMEFVLEASTDEMKFQEFVKRIQLPQRGRDTYSYLQQPLNDTVGPNIFSDFRRFNWELVKRWSGDMKWGSLTNNMLLIGEPGNITPVHYDEQQNLFCQVGGEKRCLLFHPRHFDKLYPYPVYHPCDRQSKVNLRAPDLSLYPLVSQLEGMECVLSPGDVLYIPIYWWHQIESLEPDLTTSITFWFKAGSIDTISFPLSATHKVAMMRNIEKMLTEALKDPKEINELFCNIVEGRYFKEEK
ncbi:Hypoxia-inducible factor 1-alpha inhibitor [Oopsacas minuta]|uniref:Hypoxia-inducible factor 1-alpha inhibitor n=1 Tax=Oopsacas minuta TaxID=111878 RepID=A0AAV7JTP3_9METZ|nr:Hypoxia-inducible factor 1-alpha inhibitor [Oopsacas minuta]